MTTDRIWIGVDLSLVSPGVAVFSDLHQSWHLFAFQQGKRAPVNATKTWRNVHIEFLPNIPKHSNDNTLERYEHIRHHLVDVVVARFHQQPNAHVTIHLESYAFNAHGSHSYKLQELGGIIKHSLWRRFPGIEQRYVPPTRWKKCVVGSGRATKWDVVQWLRASGPAVDLATLLYGTGATFALRPDKPVPSPCQDMADAMCLALYREDMLPRNPTRRRKRKRSISDHDANTRET